MAYRITDKLKLSLADDLKRSIDEKQAQINQLQSQISEKNALTGSLSDQITDLRLQLEETKMLLQTTQKEKINLQSLSEDPRMKNRALPNDAVLTYKYGARAYEHPLYPGFVWRNGFWYAVTEDSKFIPNTPDMYIRIADSYGPLFPLEQSKLKNKEYLYGGVPAFTTLSDVYVPIIIGGHRCFVAGGAFHRDPKRYENVLTHTFENPNYLRSSKINETSEHATELKQLLTKYQATPMTAELYVYNPENKQLTVGLHKGYSLKAEDTSEMALAVNLFVFKGIYNDNFPKFVKNYKPELCSGFI